MSEKLSDAAQLLMQEILLRSFEWSIDYTIPNEEDEVFLEECRTLDEIVKFCNLNIDSFEDYGRKILAEKKGDEQ